MRCGAGDAALIVFVVQKADLRRYGNSIHYPPTIGAAMISLPA